jgi:hypothetical protein
MIKTCEIRECGAVLKVINVEGRPFAVNPKSVEMVVEDGEGGYRLARGFEPHSNTCVHIGGRISRREARGE